MTKIVEFVKFNSIFYCFCKINIIVPWVLLKIYDDQNNRVLKKFKTEITVF